MISRILTLVAVAAVMLVGWIALARRQDQLAASVKFLDEYHHKFHDYLNSRGQDMGAYNWLTIESVKMQKQLGQLGVFQRLKPAGANYFIPNVQILLNTLPDLHKYLNDPLLSTVAHLAANDAQTINEVLLRHFGVLNDSLADVDKKLQSPFALFRAGIEALVLVPITFLNWFNVVGDSTASSWSQSFIVRLATAIFWILGNLSAIAGLLVDWEVSVSKVRAFFGI